MTIPPQATLQVVTTRWTKRSRGGDAATVRNATPVAFRLPAGSAPLVHAVEMHEEHGFRPVESIGGPATAETVSLRVREGQLTVFVPVPAWHAIPPRPRRPPAVRLAPGEWVRWQLNFRFSSLAGMQDWSYWQDTVNVACGPVSRDVFLGTPTYRVDERGSLR
ncbi:hypothetical protein [Oerskovia enterophila]|uniref:Uncharacterized protein n=1 Tax=Oerskovia enterophila TaxID=43678 RepID=A0A163SKN7_9CELL|nr:hypothetical protein [Oerskovia enterophila]KZM36523.1 hypothetical protein OJAG_07840 [Oerskovia enterophila]